MADEVKGARPLDAHQLGGPELEGAVALIQRRLPNVRAIYVFGSYASGQLHAESDVDLAVLPAHPLGAVERWELQEDLAAELGRDVDLVDLLTAPVVLRVEVLKGRLLAETSRPGREAYEARTLGEYARFNEARKAIVDDVYARGSVHG